MMFVYTIMRELVWSGCVNELVAFVYSNISDRPIPLSKKMIVIIIIVNNNNIVIIVVVVVVEVVTLDKTVLLSQHE